jgi:hypothetical protein
MALHYDTILCHLLSNIGLKLTYYFHHTFFASNTYMEDVRVLGAIEFAGEVTSEGLILSISSDFRSAL